MLQPVEIKVHWTTGGLNSSELLILKRISPKLNECANNAFMSNGINGMLSSNHDAFDIAWSRAEKGQMLLPQRLYRNAQH